VQKRNKTDAT